MSISIAIMDTMYARVAKKPEISFFLFGPRGTGKTTWLREQFSDATWFNLLTDADYLALLGNSGVFRERVLANQSGGWIVVDEVQKIPSLLNEVHDLISLHGEKYRFALSGSSARKLKRLNGNLLAGRALDKKFFPLVYPEIKSEFDLTTILRIGSLPGVFNRASNSEALLESYVSTYLREEIQQEALVRNLDSFSRFLRVAGVMNGSVVDVSNIASECGVQRKSVERYFDTLVDTLVAFRLPAFQPRLKTKERSRPKFYLFDCGVIRTLTGRVRAPLAEEERGNLFETLIVNEVRAALSYLNTGGELSYYGTDRNEVDLIASVAGESYGIEIKASERWRTISNRTLVELENAGKIRRAYGVYLGQHRLQSGQVTVLPFKEFLEALWSGELFA